MKKNDWRLTNQLKFLYGKEWTYKKYEVYDNHWDHDHCKFCWGKFPNDFQFGYATMDEKYWVCEKCFNDFKNQFNWVVKDKMGP